MDTIEAFKNELQKEYHIKKKLPQNNLTKNEIEALKDLSIRDDIIIAKAGKGEAIVIIDIDSCINEANQQLNNKVFYKDIPNDPIDLNRKNVNNGIKELKSAILLNEKTATKLEVEEAETPAFNMYPNMNKAENPGRPVINSVNCHTTSISQYVDHHQQPHVK